jgi:hypothetical protein
LAFKGKQSIDVINKLKYRKAVKYQEQIIEYYKAFEEALKGMGGLKT